MISLALIFATVALLPIDIFLVSSTVDSHTGLKKLWADRDTIYWMTFTVQVMYYSKLNNYIIMQNQLTHEGDFSILRIYCCI